MDPSTAARLIALNDRFYEQFGGSFSETRGRLQPGVMRFLSTLNGNEDLLDLGCGNGGLAVELGRRGHRGRYLGVDFSQPLLEAARKRTKGFPAGFLRTDLTRPDALREQISAATWPLVTCFAVLHHIPGMELRLGLLRAVRGWLAPDGRLALSNWQFLDSPRLVARLQPWEAAGLTPSLVDPGDALMDWKRGGTGLRYVHHFTSAELAHLAALAGFSVTETYLSDGAGGKLGLYQKWKPAG